MTRIRIANLLPASSRLLTVLAFLLGATLCYGQFPDLATLPLVVSNAGPRVGSFHRITKPHWPPLPFNNCPGCPVYALGGNAFLIDDRAVDYSAIYEADPTEKVLRTAEAALGLRAASEDSLLLLDDGGLLLTSETQNNALLSFSTNDLWLEITGLSNNAAALVIHSPVDNGVFDLYATTNLTGAVAGLNLTNWLWLLRTNAGETHLSTPLFSSTEGYYLLGTTNDTDGDGLPDAYESLVSHTDPNTPDNPALSFSISFPKGFVNTLMTTGTLAVVAGFPTEMAVLVNSTHFDGATWVPLVTLFPVDLGTNDGPKDIWVGLRGPLPDCKPQWQWARVMLDQTPPVLHITSPAHAAAAFPMIQLLGFSEEPISDLRFDVEGWATNQQGFVSRQHYDSGWQRFTTNDWQCYDIDLREGSTVITLRATDLAGNVTTVSRTLTFTTNDLPAAPALRMTYPENGMQLGGDTLTVRGQLDDPTARVAARLVNTNGTLENAGGVVERYGQFWVENLPLSGGTNTLTLTVTDVAGHSSVTNLTLIKSDVLLTMDAVPDEQLHLPATTVTGTVQDATYAVWVNGVEAVVEADGHWTASGVPVSEGGTASFHARAYPPGEHPATGSGVPGVSPASPYAVSWAVDNDKKPQVRVLEYHVDWTETISHGTGGKLSEIVIDAPNSSAYHLSWHDSAASDGWSRVEFADRTCQKNFAWPPDVCILREQSPSLFGTMTNTCGDGSTNWPAPVIYAEHCNVTNVIISTNSASVSTNSYRRTAQTILQLRTGGKPLSHRMTLFRVHAEASRITSPRWPVEGGYSGEAIPATNLAVGELGAPGADGNLWKALPDNSIHDVTVSVQGGYAPTNFYKFDVVPTKHKLRIDWIGTGNVTDTTTVSWAGQKMDLRASFDPALPSGVVASNYQWTVPGPAYADIDYTSQYGQAPLLTNLFTNAVLYYWAKEFDRAEVKCTAEVRGNRSEGTASFEVRKPEVAWRLTPKYPVGVYTNYQYSGTWLACGLGGEDSSSNGMVFEWQIPNVASLKGYTNTFFGIKMIQLVVTSIDENFAIAIGTNRSRFITANGLDSRYPFDSWGPIMPPSLFPLQEYDTEKDSPAERLNGTTSYTRRADDFTTILLFWPDGGRPVPLKSASWGWAGRAALVGTNYPPVYEMLPSPTHPQSAIGQPLDCPPTWSDNITHLVAPNSAGWTTNTTTFPIN